MMLNKFKYVILLVWIFFALGLSGFFLYSDYKDRAFLEKSSQRLSEILEGNPKQALNFIEFMYLDKPLDIFGTDAEAQESTDYYYIGQWEWYTADEDMDYWRAPQFEHVTGSIDLRTADQAGRAGGTPQGFALFAYSQEVTDPKLTYLGNDLDEKPNARALGAVQTKLGITPNKESIRDIVYELLTEEADPTGKERWKPLRPGVDGKNKVYFGREGKIMEVAITPFVSPEWENIQLAIQEDYKHLLRTEKHTLVAKWLDYQEDKFNVHYTHFLPDGEIRLASLPHETTIGDTFTNTDGTDITLHTASGPNGGFSWTEIDGDADITASNTLLIRDNPTSLRAETDLSSDDHYVKIDRIGDATVGQNCAPAARRNSSNQEAYLFLHQRQSSSGYRLYVSSTTGTLTQIGSSVSEGSTVILPVNDIELEVNGSTLTGSVGGFDKITETHTGITGNLRGGLRNSGSTNLEVDNFEAADLAVGPAPTRRIWSF